MAQHGLEQLFSNESRTSAREPDVTVSLLSGESN